MRFRRPIHVARPALAGALVAAVALPVAISTEHAPAEAAATATVFCGDRAATEATPTDSLESYTAINPRRLVDTRDGTGGVTAALGKGCTLRIDMAGSPAPAAATAVALSLTAVAERNGFFTVYPCAAGRPATSNLNSRAGVATPNLSVAMLDSARRVCIFSNQPAHLVVDLAGWWGPGPDRFTSIDPRRVYDTRELAPPQRLPAGDIRDVQVTGGPIPAGATAAVVNLTATDAAGAGWLLAYPCGQEAPLASNLNFLAGETRAVAAVVGLGSSGAARGKLCVRGNRDVHFIVDVVGYYAPAPSFGPAATLTPQPGTRLVDTRDGTGGPKVRFAAGQIRRFDPVARNPLRNRAVAVLLNVIAVDPSARGYLRVYPCTSAEPTSSSLNFAAGENASNLVPVELSATREVCIYAHVATDVVVDLFGVMGAPAGSLAERLSFGSVSVWPAFTPPGPDYAIRCAAGQNALDLTIDALPLTSVRINGAAVAPRATHRVVTTTDRLTTVRLTRGSSASTYSFRCLPADFPDLAVDRPGAPSGGWYLTTFGQGSSDPTLGQFTVIFDQRGAPVWYKRNDRVLIDAKLTPDGNISLGSIGQFFGADTDDLSRRVHTLSGNLVADLRTNDPSLPVDHHDYLHLPNGGGAFVSYPLRRNVDLTGLGAGFFADDSVVDGAIVETNAAGAVIGAWNSADHFADDSSKFPQRFGRYPGEPNGGEVDIVHINSIDLADDGNPAAPDYIVSGRHLDTVFRVSRSTGDVVWTLGAVASTDPGARALTIVGDPLGGPRRPHDARLRNGVLTMFDNRTGAGAGPARAVAYAIDAVNGTATMLWERRHPAGMQSAALGSVRVGTDGAVLIDWGTPLDPIIEELDAAGNRLLAISLRPSGATYRIVKYPASTFERGTLRSLAGGVLQAP